MKVRKTEKVKWICDICGFSQIHESKLWDSHPDKWVNLQKFHCLHSDPGHSYMKDKQFCPSCSDKYHIRDFGQFI